MIDGEVFKKLKIYVAKNGTTLKEFLTELIEKELKNLEV
jgi:hypothetical protein